jgi:hypothetical protein
MRKGPLPDGRERTLYFREKKMLVLTRRVGETITDRFVYWYLIRFGSESPFSHSALDIKSFAMALLRTDFRQSTKRNMPKR